MKAFGTGQLLWLFIREPNVRWCNIGAAHRSTTRQAALSHAFLKMWCTRCEDVQPVECVTLGYTLPTPLRRLLIISHGTNFSPYALVKLTECNKWPSLTLSTLKNFWAHVYGLYLDTLHSALFGKHFGSSPPPKFQFTFLTGICSSLFTDPQWQGNKWFRYYHRHMRK